MTRSDTEHSPVDVQHDALVVSAPMSAGDFEVRLARTEDEVLAAQRLRYRTLFVERGGQAGEVRASLQADVDEWDASAFHIIVASRERPEDVVGTLRLVSRTALAPGQAFYTERAFDLSGMRARYPRMVEFGRWCIDSERRQGVILLLIWRYAMGFIVDNEIDAMFGCVSFPGTDVTRHADILAYLYANNLAPPEMRPTPRVPNHVRLADQAATAPDFQSATRELPPLLRGYLKLGAYVSDTAIIDPEFNTTFVGLYIDAAEMLAGNTPLVGRRRERAG